MSAMAALVTDLNAVRIRAGDPLLDGDEMPSLLSRPHVRTKGSRWAAWTVHCGEGEVERERIEVQRRLDFLWRDDLPEMTEGDESRTQRLVEDEPGRMEREMPTSHVEYLCMLVDELLSYRNARTVMYHRLCGRSVAGLLEDTILVRYTTVKEEDETGRLVNSSHLLEALEAEEWEQEQRTPANR